MNHRSLCLFALMTALAPPVLGAYATEPSRDEARKGDKMFVYVGTYTQRGSKGIYLFTLDSESGRVEKVGLAADTPNPTFLAIHPNHRFLYAANEIGDFQGKPSGAVSAYSIDSGTGALKLLNQQPSGGGGPCHLVVDKAGKNVLAANYGGGSVTVIPIESDGSLANPSEFIQHEGKSVNLQRQEGPHAHSINLDAANRFAFAADLGLDKIMIYRFDPAKGTLKPNAPAFASLDPGSGPRHFAFHPGGKFAYVINEMASTVTAFTYDSKAGELHRIQTITTLPAGFTGESTTAEVQVHPSGKFLYGSNRGHNSIAIFHIDPASGKLTPIGHESTQGATPRNFRMDPSGRFLLAANQDTDSVVVFRIDPATGKLTPTGQKVDVSMPVCIRMIPAK